MASVSLGSVVAFLGLAIVAEGGVRIFFAHGALVAVTVVTLAALVAAQFSRASLSPGVREDRGNRWVIGALGVLGLLLAFAPPYSDRFGWWVFGGEGVRWLGVALYTIGGALRLAPVFVLGKRFSGLVAIQSGHQLVTDGLYAIIRNPSYLGLFVLCFGWALAFRSGLGVVITSLMAIPLHARMNSEERLLAEQFGAEYAAYRARSWRLIPWIY